MKVALVCTGLEHMQRGFESFSLELFQNFRSPEIQLDLVKGSGIKKENEYSVWCIRRSSKLLSLFGNSGKGKYQKYKIEGWTFAFAFLRHLLNKKYDVIHTSDNELAKALLFLRKKLRLKFSLVFSNGAPWGAEECRQFDLTQEVTQYFLERNRAEGLPTAKSVYVPYGINVFAYDVSQLNKARLRAKYGITESAFVVLSLSALKFSHKRLDYLVEEFAGLSGDFFLLMAGGEDEETPAVKAMAENKLAPGNFKFLTVPYSQVIELLALSDLLVSTSLSEAFGRVLAEAAASKTPVLCHRHYAATEILAHESSKIDMIIEGELHKSILKIAKDPELSEEIAAVNYNFCKKKFDWQNLNGLYADMYEKARSLGN